MIAHKHFGCISSTARGTCSCAMDTAHNDVPDSECTTDEDTISQAPASTGSQVCVAREAELMLQHALACNLRATLFSLKRCFRLFFLFCFLSEMSVSLESSATWKV